LLSTVPSTLQKPVVFSWMVRVVTLPELVDELLLEDELPDELLEFDDELELLLELEELDELELLEDELEELVELLLEEDELELDDDELELLEVVVEEPEPVQVGAIKLPSWVPWKPNTLLAVAPGAGSCQSQQWVNWNVVPGLVPVRVPTFHWLVMATCSGKVKVTVQPVSAVVPVLVTLTSSWKDVPPVLEAVAVQLCAA
jgi:hypothetical protein